MEIHFLQATGILPVGWAKRAALWGEFVRDHVVRQVPHRRFVFALPKPLRPAFRYRRSLLPNLAVCAWNAVTAHIRADTCAIVSIQDRSRGRSARSARGDLRSAAGVFP